MKQVVSLDSVTKKFGAVAAVDGISLSLGEGDLFGLLGPNGSGKTTTIKMLTGQIPPTSGNISVMGIDAVKHPIKVREAVGIIPEQETPPSFLTAEEYMHFVARIRHIDHHDVKIREWLDFMEFGDQRHILCKDLSRGTRQKLMFAQAFLHDPKLAFIDEPLINLDPIMQKKVKDFLKDYVKKGGTVFLSTHILEIAEEICTRVGIIDKGRLVYVGDMPDIRKKKLHLEDFFLRLVKNG
jgi:ABC-2 type transport system ATP-binding protein